MEEKLEIESATMFEPTVIHCDDLDEALENYTQRLGYRLDLIFPADSPREAMISKDGDFLRLVRSPLPNEHRPSDNADAEWFTGRAGMEYRDLIPRRLDGKVIASHIRITKGGEVPDYVHYHKVDFQMIYCVRGLIQVVYEDQGPPFWLETGDCVLQPPEIRHRVLYAEAGAEVIEVSSPAEHETWVEHDIELPTNKVDRARNFGGQSFVHSRAGGAEWQSIAGQDVLVRQTGILEASGRLLDVRVFRRPAEMGATEGVTFGMSGSKRFTHPLGPGEELVVDFYLV